MFCYLVTDLQCDYPIWIDLVDLGLDKSGTLNLLVLSEQLPPCRCLFFIVIHDNLFVC